jgi:hypothetical protein
MVNLKSFSALVLLTGIIIFQCKENPIDLNPGQVGSNILGTLKDTTLYAINDSSYQTESIISTQFSSRLILGSVTGFEARPIFRITNFAKVPDSATIIDTKFRLVRAGISSIGVASPISVNIYPVITAWTTNLDEVWDDYQQNFDPSTPYASIDISPEDTTDIQIEFNADGLDKVRTWFNLYWENPDTLSSENAGIILDFQNADFLQYLYAINSGYDPTMIVNYTIPDDTTITTDTLVFNLDAFIYGGEFPKIADRDYVATLFPHSTLLQFNLESFLDLLPRDVSLNSANLKLYIDRENSLINSELGISHTVTLKLTKIAETGVTADSTLGRYIETNQWASDSSFIEVKSGDNRKRLAIVYIQPQLINIDSTSGLVISIINALSTSQKITNERDYYSYLAFYTAKDPNLALRPKLTIKYWLPPPPRL